MVGLGFDCSARSRAEHKFRVRLLFQGGGGGQGGMGIHRLWGFRASGLGLRV